jgi:hypothetical protein
MNRNIAVAVLAEHDKMAQLLDDLQRLISTSPPPPPSLSSTSSSTR